MDSVLCSIEFHQPFATFNPSKGNLFYFMMPIVAFIITQNVDWLGLGLSKFLQLRLVIHIYFFMCKLFFFFFFAVWVHSTLVCFKEIIQNVV